MTTAAVGSATRPKLSHLQGSVIVLLTGMVFSFGGLAFRQTDAISAWEYVVFRGLGAVAVAVVVLTAQYRERLPEMVRDIERTHIAAGIILGAISCSFIVSLQFATVAFVLFLQTMAPIAAAYFSWLVMRERVSRNVVLATIGTMVGMAVMVSGTFTADIRPAGLLAIVIPVGFGLYATLIRSATRIDPTVPILASGTTMIVVGLVAATIAGGLSVSTRDAAIGFFAGSALLGIPLTFFNRAQRVVPAAETSLLLLVEVVLAPVWVWVFVSEQPEATTLAGGAIILATVIWLTVVRVPRRGRVLTSRG